MKWGTGGQCDKQEWTVGEVWVGRAAKPKKLMWAVSVVDKGVSL